MFKLKGNYNMIIALPEKTLSDKDYSLMSNLEKEDDIRLLFELESKRNMGYVNFSGYDPEDDNYDEYNDLDDGYGVFDGEDMEIEYSCEEMDLYHSAFYSH